MQKLQRALSHAHMKESRDEIQRQNSFSVHEHRERERDGFLPFAKYMADRFVTSAYFSFLELSYCAEVMLCFRAIKDFEENYDDISPALRSECVLVLI